jgi:hypothetical protein
LWVCPACACRPERMRQHRVQPAAARDERRGKRQPSQPSAGRLKPYSTQESPPHSPPSHMHTQVCCAEASKGGRNAERAQPGSPSVTMAVRRGVPCLAAASSASRCTRARMRSRRASRSSRSVILRYRRYKCGNGTTLTRGCVGTAGCRVWEVRPRGQNKKAAPLPQAGQREEGRGGNESMSRAARCPGAPPLPIAIRPQRRSCRLTWR